MAEQICRHCKEPVGSGAVMCPFYKELICMAHCKECKHSYEWLSGERRCRYHQNRREREAARKAAENLAKE